MTSIDGDNTIPCMNIIAQTPHADLSPVCIGSSLADADSGSSLGVSPTGLYSGASFVTTMLASDDSRDTLGLSTRHAMGEAAAILRKPCRTRELLTQSPAV